MILSSTTDHEPLQFTIGAGQVLPGFEQALVGMNPGELKTILIPAEGAFGPHNPKVGEQVQFRQPDGQIMTVLVTDVSELSVTIDANHPLAGKDLTFDIQFLEIV
jgi:peptidylprolyl isomerase